VSIASPAPTEHLPSFVNRGDHSVGHFATAWLLFASLIAACGGCGAATSLPPLGLVSGRVVLDEQPVADATVIFFPTTGRRSAARTASDGTYQLQFVGKTMGAVVGNHRVSIVKLVPDPAYQPTGRPDQPPPQQVNLLPSKYAGSGSILDATVTAGRNTCDFQLTSK